MESIIQWEETSFYRVDKIEVRKISDILIHLQRVKTVGDEMVLEILRDNRTTNVTIVLQERPKW